MTEDRIKCNLISVIYLLCLAFISHASELAVPRPLELLDDHGSHADVV
jgi:hypothetical protein